MRMTRGNSHIENQFTTARILLLVFFVCFSAGLSAQTPGIPYQAYITDTNGGYIPGEQIDIPLANADIVLQFEIRNDKGQVEYIEEIPVKTDEFGMVSTVIGVGNGTPVMGKFSDINWNGKPKKMYTDIDFTGTGNNFKDHGNMDIVYIPGPGGGISETTTTLKDNGDGSYTYTNEDGTTTTFSVPQHNTGDPNTLGTAGNVGDIYVDQSTGAMYMHGGSSWVPLNTSSSETTTTLVDNGDGTYTYTSEDGTVTTVNTVYSSAGNGDPITNNITGKVGDIYIDRSTGEVYIYDGNTWFIASSSETTTTLANNNNGTYTYTSEDGTTTTFDVTQSAVGDPQYNGTTGTAGDVYVDESTGDIYTHNGTTWVNQTNINANNGLTARGDLVQLGGNLIQPTTIGTDATNTLAVTGLEDADMTTDDFELVVVDKNTGVLKKTDASALRLRQYIARYTAARGDYEFDTPQNILELDNIDAYRNGARIDFVQIDANTIKLDLTETGGCHSGDEIRIVQLQ